MSSKAAGVVYWWDGDKLLLRLMVPSDPRYGGSSPQLAKGRLDGKSALQTAREEATEELGAIPSLMEEGEFFGRYIIAGMDARYNMDVYLFHYRDATRWQKPHYETGRTVDIGYGNRDLVRKSQRHIVDKIFTALMNRGK